MRPGTRREGVLVLVIVSALSGCSPGAKEASTPPAPASEGAAQSAVTTATTPPAPAAAASKALDALTRPKFSDQDYIGAIADLEGANGTGDAAADFAAGRRQLLGVPQANGPSRLVGVRVVLDQLPKDVRIVRIMGIVEGSENRHVLRFEMLMRPYAEAYNQAMLRAIL